MANLALIFDQEKPGRIGAIEIDATLSRNHDLESEATDFPVEKGSNISDHILQRPDSISINGFVTNSPIKEFSETDRDVARSNELPNRAKVAFDELRRIKEENELVTVVTKHHVYDSMVLQSFRPYENRNTGDALWFNATLKRIRLVGVESGAVPDTISESHRDTASSEVETGKAATTNATPEEEQRVSWLKQILDGKGKLGNWRKKVTQ